MGIVVLLAVWADLHGQETQQIVVDNSDKLLIQKRNGEEIRKLLGNVRLRQETTTMFCDSAYLYPKRNEVEAMSRVRINYADSVDILADRLAYNGNTEIARLFDNVVMTHEDQRLETDRLTYFRNQSMGRYTEGGKLTDPENTLTSQIGEYFTKRDEALFYKDVVLVNEDYTLATDTLRYNTDTKTAFFNCPTRIVTTDQEKMYAEDGFFETEEKNVFLYGNPWFEDSTYKMKADTIYYDDRTGVGKGVCAVELNAKDSTLDVVGEKCDLYEREDRVVVSDHAYVLYKMEEDSLVIFADTLEAIDDSTDGRRTLEAWYNVRLYMRDLQSIADSIKYDRIDSIFTFMKDPVLWSAENQLSGDTVRLFMADGYADSLAVIGSAFVIQQEDSLFFNQAKGKKMFARLDSAGINWIRTEGNSESMYLVKDGGAYVGLNHSFSSALEVFLADNKAQKIIFFQQPEATFYPIHEVWFKTNQLEDFNWQPQKRPVKYIGAGPEQGDRPVTEKSAASKPAKEKEQKN